jgi:PAS domain S-box-containing protein
MSYSDSDQDFENYKNIFENSLNAIILTHQNKTSKDAIFYANSAAVELFGYSEQEIYDLSWEGIVDNFDEYLPVFLEELSSVGKAKAELTFIKKDGSKFKGEIFSNLLDFSDKLTNLSIVKDITESKIAEKITQELLEKEQKLREELQKLYNELDERNADLQAVLNIAPIVLWISHDPDCNVITGNDYADQIVMNVPKGGNISASAKLDTAAVSYKVYNDGVELKPEELPAQIAATTGEPVPETELELVFPDGRKVQLLLSAVPLLDDKGSVRGSLTAGVDITRIKLTENALRESEERLRLAQTLGNVGVWDWNTVTNELHFTPELEQLYGLNKGTIKSYEDWRQLTHPDDIGKIEAERDEKIANHEPFDLEFRVLHKSGQKHWLSAKGGAIYNDEGDVLRVLGINTDITERKKADKKIQDLIEQLQQANEEYRKSEDRFQTLADNIPNLAWMANAEGWIFWYNKQWYEYTGTTLEEMQGWGWQKVHHPDYVDSITEEWNTKLKNEEPYDNIFPLKGKDGNYRWFLTRVTPIRDAQGNLIRWFGTNTDVTERINREEELEITMNDLEHSNKELEQFAYITSHDLREPLRMITSFLQLLERRYKDQLDQDANEFIGFAVDGAKRLDAMTNDLLQYSKITSEKREVTQVNFERVLEYALTNLKVPIEENKAVITHDPLPTINGDEQLKVQLFQNIIGNAIKYRSEKTPEIHISATKEKNHYLFSIKDNGIGISPEHLERIFTIFQRLHTNEEYEGTGIGLAIAQKIVHQQGGQIWVESEIGKGTTFYFTIPMKS